MIDSKNYYEVCAKQHISRKIQRCEYNDSLTSDTSSLSQIIFPDGHAYLSCNSLKFTRFVVVETSVLQNYWHQHTTNI